MTTPVIFIHGLWLHPTSWTPWLSAFEQEGYAVSAPGWPGVANTVAAAREDPDSIADHGIDGRLPAEALVERLVLHIHHRLGGRARACRQCDARGSGEQTQRAPHGRC